MSRLSACSNVPIERQKSGPWSSFRAGVSSALSSFARPIQPVALGVSMLALGCQLNADSEGEATGATPVASTSESSGSTSVDSGSSGTGTDTSSSGADGTTAIGSGSSGDPAECGNGLVEEGEDCDVADFGGVTCEDDFDGEGALGCTAECTYDFTNCAYCGDENIDLGEQCDGDMVPQTCLDLGYGPGTLLCSPICTYDLSQCPDPVCGDGVINDGGEECDGDDLNELSCEDLGFPNGPKDGLACDPDCNFDTTGC